MRIQVSATVHTDSPANCNYSAEISSKHNVHHKVTSTVRIQNLELRNSKNKHLEVRTKDLELVLSRYYNDISFEYQLIPIDPIF